MKQNTNLKLFDDWMLWKNNSFKIGYARVKPISTPKHISEFVNLTCTGLGLRPGTDFQYSTNEVRFRTKTFLAMFKMNYNNG